MERPRGLLPKVRFMRFVIPEPNTGCWLWLGAGKSTGYGTFGTRSLNIGKNHMSAHRASYFLFNGDPGNLCVCHKCDTPACVNPQHLFLGTNKDNTQDMIKKNRQQKPRKIPIVRKKRPTMEQKQKILSLKGTNTQANIAIMFDLSESSVSRIMNNFKK